MADAPESTVTETTPTPLPERVPLLAGTQFVLYPFMIAPLIVQNENDAKMVDAIVRGSRMVGIFAPRALAEGEGPPQSGSEDAQTDERPFVERIHNVGTLAMILRMLKIPDGSLRLLVHGLRRVRLHGEVTLQPWPEGSIEPIDDVTYDDDEINAMRKNARELLAQIVEHSSSLPNDLLVAANNTDDPSRLADLIASNLNIGITEQQQVLEIADTKQRLVVVQKIMNRELEIARLGSKIQSQVKTSMDRVQRDYFLREQMKAIRRELGEEGDGSEELDELAEQIKKANLPEHALKVAHKELSRLRTMGPQSAEYTVSRTYLDWLVTLPWSVASSDNIDLKKAKEVLDEDHYDLEKIKERILDYLAVIKLRKRIRGPLLCLSGPPGVGKTSLGRSVARAMGRKFVRISLGGVRDEAEIRGHRRTYIGSMPGRIIKALRDAGTNNPVLMLDEIDKLGSDFRGDPASALLEVLDPEQNSTFADHYLDMPFDLSNVMFITTANALETIPGPLLDRMEVIRLSGYTLREKIQIAHRYLIPRALEHSGLKPAQVHFSDAALERLVEDHTREAGLRNLEREITTICRKAARAVAENPRGKKMKPIEVDAAHVTRVLGAARYERDLLDDRVALPGVSIGMAWTPTGGDILFIEASGTEGTGRLLLTGQLGEVMKESAQAAHTWLRSNRVTLGLPASAFAKRDLHIHVPAGAIPKDGPSAGVALVTAMASLLTGKPVSERLAMTGEVTIKGTVLPVGGIKEKLLAAHRSGIRHIILPRRNEKDLADVPEEVRKSLHVDLVDHAKQVLELALTPPAAKRKTPARGAAKAVTKSAKRAAPAKPAKSARTKTATRRKGAKA